MHPQVQLFFADNILLVINGLSEQSRTLKLYICVTHNFRFRFKTTVSASLYLCYQYQWREILMTHSHLTAVAL